MDFDQAGSKRVFNRLGPATNNNSNARFGPPNNNNGRSQYHNNNHHQQPRVCAYWQAGRCNRSPCNFLHVDPTASSSSSAPPTSSTMMPSSKRPHSAGARAAADDAFSTMKIPNNFNNNTWGRDGSRNGFRTIVGGGGGAAAPTLRKTQKVCHFWVQGKCGYADKCKFLHTWFVGEGFSLLTTLEGHQKCVTGIALPSGSDKLFTGAKDETMRIWDCQSGQCSGVYNLGGEVGCMISEGPFVFVGLINMVKALNPQTGYDQCLSGPVGQVYALAVGNGLLFAGTHDGKILAWKFNQVGNCFEPAAALEGHNLAVVTLYIGANNRLFSGSMDHSIRVWNLETLECLETLTDHSSVVMSVIGWDQFLISCSLDQTIKIWVATESGKLEVTYTHTEQHGLLSLCGVYDSEGKPILLCSCNDNTVRMYDLPSFTERGKIFSKQEIRSILFYSGGMFFTGDGAGQVRVWRWSPQTTATPAPAV